eukprot:9735707-Karenia_brevis.AAC.1
MGWHYEWVSSNAASEQRSEELLAQALSHEPTDSLDLEELPLEEDVCMTSTSTGGLGTAASLTEYEKRFGYVFFKCAHARPRDMHTTTADGEYDLASDDILVSRYALTDVVHETLDAAEGTSKHYIHVSAMPCIHDGEESIFVLRHIHLHSARIHDCAVGK